MHELPPEPEPESGERIVPILEVGPFEFGRVQSILEEAGIECFSVQDGDFGTVLGTRLASGFWVQVREEDAELAKKLVSQLQKLPPGRG